MLCQEIAFEFVNSINHVLEVDTIEASERRIKAAENETWEKKIHDIFNVVVNKLSEKAHTGLDHL